MIAARGFVGLAVGTSLCVVVLVLIVRAWIRNRQRRKLDEMRDSALW